MQISVWEKESFFKHKQLVIIGSGLVGLWSAYFYKLQNPSHDVLIAERGFIPTGASTRNAGFACFGSITELLEDAGTLGVDPMLELVELRYRGLKLLQEVIPSSLIDFRICGGYDLLHEMEDDERLIFREKIDWINGLLANTINEEKVFAFADHKSREFGFKNIAHVVENQREGFLHSGKLCQHLLSLVQGMGVTILNNFEVQQFATNGELFIESTRGITIKADKLLVCTNAFVKQLIPEMDVVPARGQVLVTAPIRDLKIKGTFHYDHGYYYFRNLGDRLLLGGARNKAFEEESTIAFETTSFIQAQLEQFISNHLLPDQPFTISDRWSGIMAMGSEKKPIIKQLSPNVWCAVRMSGMGVALAPIVGQQMSKLLS